METEGFTNLILSLCENPQKLARFKADPLTVLRQAGLTSAEAILAASGDASLIRTALAAKTSDISVHTHEITITNTTTNTTTNITTNVYSASTLSAGLRSEP